jgi:hypothetical protein
MAQLIYDAWQARNTERQGAGLPPLPPLTLLHSNISTLDDIRQVGHCAVTGRGSGLGALATAEDRRCTSGATSIAVSMITSWKVD